MLSLLAFAVLTPQDSPITRDGFGVPHIVARGLDQAFFQAGYACAEDRLWQMETSRRIARGKMAEVFGASYLASDKEVLATAYTDSELQSQIDALSPDSKRVFVAYANGVNALIKTEMSNGTLPTGYSDASFKPEPWSPLDSAAIAIRLYQFFGQGGAGELRNWAMFQYLQGKIKDNKALDVFDDFLWTDDPSSPVTVEREDDRLASNPPKFPVVTRAITEKHLAMMPKVPIFELLPAIKVASKETSNLVAEKLNAPFKVGSYAIVVDAKRSATGYPLLLSAPQMGHRTPSVIHEMSISCPEYEAVGMDVPGAPSIAIGHSRDAAWGMTSGVIDTTDIVFSTSDAPGTYKYGGNTKPIQSIKFTIKVKGQPDVAFEQRRTQFGPVLLESKSTKTFFSQRSSYWMKELSSFDGALSASRAKSRLDFESALRHATVSFNFFYALNDGSIGYRYLGLSPNRADGYDPRFPTPGEPAYEWKGMIPYEKMPNLANPKSGLISNWNNKPVAWWPNSDTPVWGRNFRVEALRKAIPTGKLGAQDLEFAAWSIARLEPTYWQTMPLIRSGLQKMLAELSNPRPNVRINGNFVEALRVLLSFDGRKFDGSASAFLYDAFFRALRTELFMETTGNFLSDTTFQTAAQPSVMLQALEGKTKFDYRRKRSVDAIVAAAFNRMFEQASNPAAWRYSAGRIQVPGESPIPYGDRGTYIQVIEVSPMSVRGRNVVSPGVAESGSHSMDQVPLARSWSFKSMGWGN